MNIFVDSTLSEELRRKAIYDGSVFVHSPSENTLGLCRLAQDMIEAAFHPLDPLRMYESMSAEGCAEILAGLKPKFIHHPKAKEYIQGLLAESGADLEKTYFDVPSPAHRISGRLFEIRNRIRIPSTSRHLVLGANVPNQLVDADIRT